MAAASLHAGNVFLATANPATLMTIGSGVGSAVMGLTGIVAALKEDLAKLKLSRLLGRGRELVARTRSVRNIRKDFNSIRARVKSWTDQFESANDESRGQSLVFYRESDRERGLRAHHTRDLRLQRA